MHRYIVISVEDCLSENDAEKVLSSVRMVRGVMHADWSDVPGREGAYFGAYHRCRRAYAKALQEALAKADAELRGPDGGVVLPAPRDRFE